MNISWMLPVAALLFSTCRLWAAPEVLVTGGTVLTSPAENAFEVSITSDPRPYFRTRFLLISENSAVQPTGLSSPAYTVRLTFQNANGQGGAPDDFGWGEFGGVMGWADRKNRTGIGLRVIGVANGNAQVEIAHVDLSKGYSSGMGTGQFRTLSGNRFAFTGSTFPRREPVTLALTFQTPAAEDLKAWPEAKVRVTADVRKGSDVIDSVTFLSSMPRPEQHVSGYFGGSENAEPTARQPIGRFSDFALTVERQP